MFSEKLESRDVALKRRLKRLLSEIPTFTNYKGICLDFLGFCVILILLNLIQQRDFLPLREECTPGRRSFSTDLSLEKRCSWKEVIPMIM